jgi:hypothetical protein
MLQSKKIHDIEIPPSPAAIAAGVNKSARHRELDARITALADERQSAIDEMRSLIASNTNEMNAKAIRLLQKKCEAIELTLGEPRREVREHRDAHSTRVREALRPQCVVAAKAMIEGLNAFVTAAQKFNACQDEIDRVGGEP